MAIFNGEGCRLSLSSLFLEQVRCWEVQDNGQTVPKAQQMHTGPVLGACWSDVGPRPSSVGVTETLPWFSV